MPKCSLSDLPHKRFLRLQTKKSTGKNVDGSTAAMSQE